MANNENFKKYGLIAGVVIVALLVLVVTGYTGEVSKRKVPPPASVQINSEPTSSNVYIDGNLEGNTPQLLSIDSGAHVLEVSRNGYETYTDTITLTTGRNDPIDVTLIPLQEEQ